MLWRCWPRCRGEEVPVQALLAGGADTMTELCVGPLGDIAFDLCPLIVLAADALAARTDGDEPAQNLREGLTEGPLECSGLLLEAEALLQEALLSFARGT